MALEALEALNTSARSASSASSAFYVMPPSKIICVGRNYADHAKELGNVTPSAPLLFMKPPSSVVATGEAIILPRASERVDYEGEIGIVIGTRTRGVDERDARTSVRAIVALNDVTARDLQQRDNQWTRAKGFDTFCPVGAEGALPDRLEDLVVITRVNGASVNGGRRPRWSSASPGSSRTSPAS